MRSRLSEPVKRVHPSNVCEMREVLFDKPNSIGNKNTSKQKIFKDLMVTNFESVSVQTETFKITKTTTWIKEDNPNSVTISSNLVNAPFFLQLRSSLHRCIFYWSSGRSGVTKQGKNEPFFLIDRDTDKK